MGFLTIFKRKQLSKDALFNKDDVEGITIEALRRFNESKNDETIKQLQKDKEFLQNQLEQANKRILILEGKEVKEEGPKPLSKLERNIYKIYLKEKPKTFEDFATLIESAMQLKPESLRVYISRIRKKGETLEFEE